MNNRKCPGCDEYKNTGCFGKDSSRKDGLHRLCKDCRKNEYTKNRTAVLEKRKEYRKNNKEKIKLYKSEYYKENKKEVLKKNKKWIEENKDRKKETDKIWNKLNRKKKTKSGKKWSEGNIEKVRESRKKWRKNNPEWHKKYMKRRCSNDVGFRLKHNLRKRIWDALKGRSKSNRTVVLIGCSVEFLVKYIERKFQKEMTWNNYGEWHIDHIKPCISFDLIKEEEQRSCFHYSNLQPLWKLDNLRKGSKVA